MNIKSRMLETCCVENEYLDKYVNLIEQNLNTPKERFKTQGHHIVPVGYFTAKYDKRNRTETERENLVESERVYLSYFDHVLAHYYLMMCSKEKYIFVTECAFFYMVNMKKKMAISNIGKHHMTQWHKEKLIAAVKSRKKTPEEIEAFVKRIKAKGAWNKGKTMSQEYRLKNMLSSPVHKEIVQCDLNGEEIRTFFSTREANRITGINRGNIVSVLKGLRGKKTAGGYIWKYK